MEIYERIICLLIGYMFGCFQTAVIIGKLTAKIDIRDYGSGNAGTTNTIRTLGTKYGVIVFVCDVLKAVAAIVVCLVIFRQSPNVFTSSLGSLVALYAGLGVIAGHNFPVFLKFKGGKGIASGVGVAICFDWRIAAVIFTIAILAVVIKKYMSLASLLIVGLFPFGVWLCGYSAEKIILAFVLGVLGYVMHRENIPKILKGTERKFDIRSKGTVKTGKTVKKRA